MISRLLWRGMRWSLVHVDSQAGTDRKPGSCPAQLCACAARCVNKFDAGTPKAISIKQTVTIARSVCISKRELAKGVKQFPMRTPCSMQLARAVLLLY